MTSRHPVFSFLLPGVEWVTISDDPNIVGGPPGRGEVAFLVESATSRPLQNATQGVNDMEVVISRDPRDKDKPTRGKDRWNAYYKGELLVEGSVDPEHDACRKLLALAHKGRVYFRHRGENYVSMQLDIERGAKKCAKEEAGRSVRIANWHGDENGQNTH
jgi:hypothetical protein